ncbi:MAG: class I SAM-dependent methyltransferase [Patescibacteria group bacterium]|nr:class I SAM-dependent methyltransferase [Patescibacteria group bacterium]
MAYDDAIFREKLHQYTFLGVDICSRTEAKQWSRFNEQYDLEHLMEGKAQTIDSLVNGLAGKKILEVGSGTGGLAVAMARLGAQVVGVEPEESACAAACLRSARYDGLQTEFTQGFGETLPFEDSSFDAVVLLEVIEHVNDTKRVMSEISRVLKPGGICLLEAPNFLWPREEHYRIWYPPLIPKPLGKIYIRLLRKNPDELDNINYVTPRRLRSLFTSHNFQQIEDYSQETFLDRVRNPETMAWSARMKTILLTLRRVPLLYPLIIKFAEITIRSGFYPHMKFKAVKQI